MSKYPVSLYKPEKWMADTYDYVVLSNISYAEMRIEENLTNTRRTEDLDWLLAYWRLQRAKQIAEAQRRHLV